MSITDAELKMHAFRLMRSARYRKAAEVVAAMEADFPDVDKARIERVLSNLASDLMRHYE